MATCPLTPSVEEAVTALPGSASSALEAVREMRPPFPAKALAMIWLPCNKINSGSMVTLPPSPVPPRTVAVI
jgi:hypothetical protein